MMSVLIQFVVVATLCVLERRAFDGTSEATTHATGPHAHEKKKPYRQQKATSHRPAATLLGSAVPMIATMNMQMVCIAPPHRSIVRRPR